jgi:hypothetical protein
VQGTCANLLRTSILFLMLYLIFERTRIQADPVSGPYQVRALPTTNRYTSGCGWRYAKRAVNLDEVVREVAEARIAAQ